jgi:hypothetical protein
MPSAALLQALETTAVGASLLTMLRTLGMAIYAAVTEE